MERNDVQADRGGGGLSTQDLLEAEPQKEQARLPRDTPRKPRLTSQGRSCSRSKRLVNSVSSGR
jgi:hypothetical protein